MKDQELTEVYLDGSVVFPGKIIRLEHWNVRLPNGSVALREVACHPGASAVVALDEEGNIILVRQHRIAVGRLTLEIPAGKLDSRDEDRLLAAQRELAEETGFTAGSWTKLTDLLTTPGFCSEKISLYLAQELSAGDMHPDDDEFLNVVKLPLSEVKAMIMRGEIGDSKTIAGILMACNHLGV